MRLSSSLMLAASVLTFSAACKSTPAQNQRDQGPQAAQGEYFTAWEAHAVDDELSSTITLRSVLIEQRADGSSRVVASKVGQALLGGGADQAWVMKVIEGSTPGIGCPECESSDEPCFERWRKEAKEVPLATYTLELTPLHAQGKVMKYRLATNPPDRHEGSHKERTVPKAQVGAHLFLEGAADTFYCFTDGSVPELERQVVELTKQQPAPLVSEQERAELERALMGEAMAKGKAQYGEDFEADQVKIKLSDIELGYPLGDKLMASYIFEGVCNSCGAMVDEPEAVSLKVESEKLPQGISADPTPQAIVEYWKSAPHKEKVLGRGWSKLKLSGQALDGVLKSFK